MKKIIWIFCMLVLCAPDAGAQWISQASGFTTTSRGIRNISAVSATVVWASAYDGSGGSYPCQDITMTTNGGTLWTPHTIPGVTSLDVANIVAVDANTAWVCMFPPASVVTGQGIYKTTNGGASWVHQTTAAFSNASSFADFVYFWNANTGCCMGDPINGDFEIYTTTNGGATWTLVPGASIPDPVSGEFGVIGYYSSVGNTIWFGTNKGRIYKSLDNGNNWTVSSISGWSARYVRPCFRDALNGLVQDRTSTTTGELVRTTDGGTTWTPVATTGNVFYEDLAYVPGTAATWVSTGAVTGYDGVTYSFNDGVNWNDMANTIGNQYLATAWVNNSTGWAGGFNSSSSSDGMYKFNSVLAEPVANFAANLTSIAVGGQVLFSDLSTGGAFSWQWSFPGGNPSSSSLQVPPPVAYNAVGQYTVTLTVTNSWGTDSEVKTNYITVGTTAPPVANFTASQTSIMAGGQVQFSDLSTGVPTSWSWSFPGGTPASSTLQTPPPVTYNAAGQYTVSLTVTNSLGSNTNTKTNYITVIAAVPPVADFTASQTNILTNGQVQFTDLSVNAPSSWQWTFPGGSPGSSSLQTPPLITYSTAGQYDVTLTVTNIAGSSTNTKVNYITVSNPVIPPVANFMANQTSIPAGGQVLFTDLSSGSPTSWQWSFPGGTPASSTLQTPPPVTYGTVGQYDVSLTVTNAGGSGSNTKSQYITVTIPAAPVANFVADHTNIAIGGQVQFSDLSSGYPVSWIWSFPGGNPSSSYQKNPPPITYYSPGQYDVSLTVTNAGGSGTNTKGHYIYVGNIGVGEPDLAGTLLYPNPACDYFRVRSDETIRELTILDRLGVTVLKENPGSTDFGIRLENLPAGFYWVRLTSASGTVTRKMVISR